MSEQLITRRFEQIFDVQKHASPAVYHNTKLLLRLYRKVYWRLETRLDDMNTACFEAGNTNIATALDELSGLMDGRDTANLEECLTSLLKSRAILRLIEKSIVMLKEYPDNGALYFRILDMTYLSRITSHEDAILQEIDRSRSTYFKLKKEAIELLGVILWGLMIPVYQSENRSSTGQIQDILRTKIG